MGILKVIAYRHLRSPQKGSFSTFVGILAVIGLGIGLASLIITLSILEGFETTISEKIAGFDGHARLQHFMDQPIPFDTKIDTVLKNIPDGKSISFIQKPALIRVGSKTEGVIVEGIEKMDERFALSDILIEGTIELEPGTVILGKRLADVLKISTGDHVVLFDVSSFTNVLGKKRLQSFRVHGLFHSGLLEYDKSVVYLSLSDAQKLFGMNNLITGKMLWFDDVDKTQGYVRSIDRSLNYPWYVMSWKDKHRILFEWIRVQRWPILIIFGMIAFVGIVNIISAMAMIITEKTSEIGTLMSLGFTKKMVRKIFVLEGAIIGLAGSLFGILISVLLIWAQIRYQLIGIPEDIYFMDQIPMAVNWFVIMLVGAAGFLMSILASLWPSVGARNVSPAKALQYE